VPPEILPSRRSGRNAPAPPQETGPSGPGNSMTRQPCSDRQQNGEASNVSASNSRSRDSDTQQNGNASSSSKKRKRISARSYFKKFKMAQGADAAGNTSSLNRNHGLVQSFSLHCLTYL
jgi:hypothetical protein